MKLLILAAYTDNEVLANDIKRHLCHRAENIAAMYGGKVEAVFMEMESSVDALVANLRQLKDQQQP